MPAGDAGYLRLKHATDGTFNLGRGNVLPPLDARDVGVDVTLVALRRIVVTLALALQAVIKPIIRTLRYIVGSVSAVIIVVIPV